MKVANMEYLRLSRPYEFRSPFRGVEFALLLFVEDKTITPHEQAGISRQLVGQGCRYAVCAGHRCSTWDDSIDMASLEQDNWEPRDKSFVMTSWHERDSIEGVVHFFLNLTAFDDWVPHKFLVIVLSEQDGVLSNIRREVERQAAQPSR